MKNIIHIAYRPITHFRFSQVTFDKFQRGFEIGKPRSIPGGQIVDHSYTSPLADEPSNQMRADKSGAARYKKSFCHCYRLWITSPTGPLSNQVEPVSALDRDFSQTR